MTAFSPLLFLFLSLFSYIGAEMISSRQSSISATNASSLLFPGTSSTSNSSFSYIIPYGQTQECDIYGLTCQTGSITVGVNLTTATTTTVLQCSSYLSAQSAYLGNENDPNEGNYYNDGWRENPWMEEWAINFGRSPECRSYAEALSQGQYTLSGCGSSKAFVQTAALFGSQFPPGVQRHFSPDSEKNVECHPNSTSNVTSTLPSQNLEKRVHSLVVRGSTTVVSGHTFTSPSIYLELMGQATVNDQCTTVGPILTHPIITLPPGGLSTWKPPVNQYSGYDNFSVGEIWEDPTGDANVPIGEGVAQLKIRDLMCPTWGLGKSTSANGTVITTIGPPWLPLIVPPMELFSLNSQWSSACTALFSDQIVLQSFALFDPPIALTPAPLLLPTPVARPTPAPAPAPADPTSVPEQAKSSTEAAKPASLPNDPAAPAETGDPGKNGPAQAPDLADPAGSAIIPENSVASSKNGGDPPSDPPSDPKSPSVDGDPPSSSAPNSTPGASQQSPTDPKVPIVPIPQPVENPQTQGQGLGAIINNAFGKTGPEPDGSSATLLPPQSVFAVGAQTFTANPTGFKVNGAAVAPGGTAQTVDGTMISLDKSGVLAIGSSTVPLADPSATPVLAMAGQTFTPNPSAFSIAGTIVSAGGPAVTVGGTAISLDHFGALAIGSTTISFATPTSNPPTTKAFTVAGQTFTPNPSAFSIAGTTISADGPAVTIGGTIISLGQYGALKVGSSTINLPTLSDSFPSKVYTVAGQIFTPNPSEFPIAGTTILAGGPAATIDGTIISLGQSGVLAIGSSTIDLPTSLYDSVGQAYTVAGQVFTPNPSAFSVAGTTISAGGPAATVDGTIISLEPSGTLVIGSSTIPLLPQTAFSSDVNIDGFDVIAHSSFAVVDGVTISAAAAGVTVSGEVVSLEAGGATLDIGTGRFALPTPVAGANGSVNVQAFVGGQSKGLEVSLYWVWGVCGTLMLLMWH